MTNLSARDFRKLIGHSKLCLHVYPEIIMSMHLPRDDAIFPSHDAVPSRPVPLIVSDATRAVCFLRWRRDDRRRCGARPDEPGRSRLFMVAPAAAAAAATSVAVTNVVLLRLTGAAAGLHC